MKKILNLLLIIFLSMPCFAQSYSAIDKLENNMFGMTYSGEKDEKRIERLEKNIYGAIQSGNLNARLSNLSKDMSAEQIGQEIEPAKFTEFEEQEDNTVDYPLINEFEKKVFNQEFKTKNLNNRITNLEKKVFNKTYQNEDFNTRTDRLKSAIQISSKPKEPEDFTEYMTEMPKSYQEYFSTPYSNNSSDNFYDYELPKTVKQEYKNTMSQSDNQKVTKILNTLEKKILKRTYQNDNNEERLERLEENMFNTSFPQDKIEARLERLALAYQATKTSKKYDTNKFSQHMATAMQVGVFLLMILAMVL